MTLATLPRPRTLCPVVRASVPVRAPPSAAAAAAAIAMMAVNAMLVPVMTLPVTANGGGTMFPVDVLHLDLRLAGGAPAPVVAAAGAPVGVAVVAGAPGPVLSGTGTGTPAAASVLSVITAAVY